METINLKSQLSDYFPDRAIELIEKNLTEKLAEIPEEHETGNGYLIIKNFIKDDDFPNVFIDYRYDLSRSIPDVQIEWVENYGDDYSDEIKEILKEKYDDCIYL